MKNHHIYKTRSPFARVLAVLSVFTLLLAPGTLAGEPAPLPTEESAGSLHRLGARNCPASWYTGPQWYESAQQLEPGRSNMGPLLGLWWRGDMRQLRRLRDSMTLCVLGVP